MKLAFSSWRPCLCLCVCPPWQWICSLYLYWRLSLTPAQFWCIYFGYEVLFCHLLNFPIRLFYAMWWSGNEGSKLILCLLVVLIHIGRNYKHCLISLVTVKSFGNVSELKLGNSNKYKQNSEKILIQKFVPLITMPDCNIYSLNFVF
jgi:hypothetical protein